MRNAMLMVMMAAGVAWGRMPKVAGPVDVNVCVAGSDWILLLRAEGLASEMFAKVGLTVGWHKLPKCPSDGITIRVSDHTPPSDHPGALAYAMPFEGSKIVVFLDRIKGAEAPLVPVVTAHVMVHEI